jgi:spore coat protein H
MLVFRVLSFSKAGRALGFFLVSLLVSLSATSCRAEVPPPKSIADGADIFSLEAPVLRIKVELTEKLMQSLRDDPRKSVPATVREGHRVYTNVAVHLKGAAGSFRGVDDKPGLTLSFGKFAEGQRFFGYRKIHLNNSVQDPSYSTENICGAMFEAAGVPAPRVTNARVWLNGRDLGYYVVVEGFAKEFLQRHFKNVKGNLYDGGFCKDIDQHLEKDQGDDIKEQPDIDALVGAAREPDLAKRWERMNRVLDVNRFASFIAMDILAWDWDGYPLKPNNYRVYHDPVSDKLVFFPHGMDQMFWDAEGPIRPWFNGLVASALVQTPQGSRLYHDRIRELFQNAYQLEVITNRLARIHARNREAIAEVGSESLHYYDRAARDVREKIINRWAGVKHLIATEPAPLEFSKNATAWIGEGWREQEGGSGKMDRIKDGEKTWMRVTATGQCTASWRRRVTIEPGRYRFECVVRCSNVSPRRDDKGEGAGLRIGGSMAERQNKILGNSAPTQLSYEFDSADGSVELVCELRASRGEALFDTSSLKLVKVR